MTETVFCFETENKDYKFVQLHNLSDFKQQITNKYSTKLSWLKRKQQCKFTVTMPNNIAPAIKLAKNIKSRTRYRERKALQKRNQALEKSQMMIVNKSNYNLSHSDQLLLMKGLNFAPTRAGLRKWRERSGIKHIRNVEKHDMFDDGNDDETKCKVPDKQVSKLFSA